MESVLSELTSSPLRVPFKSMVNAQIFLQSKSPCLHSSVLLLQHATGSIKLCTLSRAADGLTPPAHTVLFGLSSLCCTFVINEVFLFEKSKKSVVTYFYPISEV